MAAEAKFQRLPALEVESDLPGDLEALVFHRRDAETPTFRLWAGGDIGFSGRLAARASEEGAGPLSEVASVLRRGDLAFANLETPLVPESTGEDLFAAPPEAARLLAAAGFDLLHLANNHIRDYGGEGLATTRRELAGAGILGLGSGEADPQAREAVRTERQGLTLSWLGCGRTLQTQEDPGPKFWEYSPEDLLAAVREAARETDLLAVSIHLGYMFVDYPHPDHRRLALDLAAAGAHLVLMHHAHVLQGVEVTDGGAVICYNLGNLLFDWTEGEVPGRQEIQHQRSGALFGFDLDPGGVAQAFALPVRVDDDWTLRWARGAVGSPILDRLERISLGWGGAFEEDFWRQRARRNTGQTLETLGRKLRQGDLSVLLEGARRLRPHHLGMFLRWAGGRIGRRQGPRG